MASGAAICTTVGEIDFRSSSPRIFCYSPAAAGLTFAGAFLGNLSALALGYSYDQVRGAVLPLGSLGSLGHLVGLQWLQVQEGLWGYNAALSCLAVGQLGRKQQSAQHSARYSFGWPTLAQIH